LGCCLPKVLIKAATLEDGSSNLIGAWSVPGRRGFFGTNGQKKATCGGSFSLGAALP